ncbi:MAG TPA: hypothetical protein DEP88_04385, partial [Verrucomicrobiales bacterium]|nr:hypothetical protein [Verrucomicrobiales bacterium]
MTISYQSFLNLGSEPFSRQATTRFFKLQTNVKLYDTLTRNNRELSPIDGETFRFYCCGPTVYGPAHIGNFRTFVMQDVFRRVLETANMKTLHVRNITDVDDKTIRDAQTSGKSLKEFTAGWTEKFHADCTALGCLPCWQDIFL